jgi:hypothetical protein
MGRKRLGSAFDDLVTAELYGYAYNSMEVCRLLNPRCQCKVNGCDFIASTVYSRLRSLQKRGKVRSILLRWFDGRPGRHPSEIPTDKFRFWFLDRRGLANRLIADIERRLLNGEEEIPKIEMPYDLDERGAQITI